LPEVTAYLFSPGDLLAILDKASGSSGFFCVDEKHDPKHSLTQSTQKKFSHVSSEIFPPPKKSGISLNTQPLFVFLHFFSWEKLKK